MKRRMRNRPLTLLLIIVSRGERELQAGTTPPATTWRKVYRCDGVTRWDRYPPIFSKTLFVHADTVRKSGRGLNSNFVCPRTLANGAHELPIGHDVNVIPVINFAGEILGPWADGC